MTVITETFAFDLCLYWQDKIQLGPDDIPTPTVIIDQDSNADATMVEITFGDRLGSLVDTVRHYLCTFLGGNCFCHVWLFALIKMVKRWRNE